MLFRSIVYSPSFYGEWLFDEGHFVPADMTAQSGSWAGLALMWLDPKGVDYFPLTSTLFWALWQCFENDPAGYHVTSILLHAASGLLLWALLAKMTMPGAWAAAVVFTVHPVCVESVAWIAEIKNTLSLPLFLASCLCWVAQDDEGETTRQKWLAALAYVFFLLAMLAKPTVVAMPVLTLLYAWWKRGRINSRDIVHAAPLFLISIVLGIVTIQFQHGRAIGGEPLPIGGIDSRIVIAGMAILFYLATIFWPINLMPTYPAWQVVPPKAWQFLPWLVIGAAMWWMWRNRETPWGRNCILAFGFFLLMIAPMLGFIDMSFMRISWVTDHFVYVAMIGPIALAVAAATTWLERQTSCMRTWGFAAAGCVTVILSAGSFLYAREWVDEERLWKYTLARNDDSWIAHNRLGALKSERDEMDAAIDHFRHAARLRADLGETKNNLGALLLKKGLPDEAVEVLEEAVQATPFLVTIRCNLAEAYGKAGRFAEARDLAAELLKDDPTNFALLTTHAIALCNTGEREKGLAEFDRLLALKPDYEPAINALQAIQSAE